MARRRVSEDEAALWATAMRDVKPMRRGAGKPAGAMEKEPARPRPATRMAASQVTPAAAPANPKATATKSRPRAFDAGDPKLDDKARRGRLAVERAIDLHGLTQETARRRLIAFIEGAARDGVRLVLVVTGKGGGRPTAADVDLMRPPRGIIRARFADWIEEEPIRTRIARASSAGPRHGGDGAFYVFLKAPRAPRR